MSLTETRKTAAAWLAIAGAAALLLCWLLAAVLMPFCRRCGAGHALHPLVERLHRRRRGYLPRAGNWPWSSCCFCWHCCRCCYCWCRFWPELPLMHEQLPLLADRFNRWLTPLLAKYGFRLSLDVVSVKAFVLKYLNANTEDAIASVLSSLKLGGSVALALLGNAILIPVALFYLLMDWSRLVERLLELVPPVWRGPFDHFMADADSVLGQYLH
ncbi:MAG: AI-2E family transporter, partial [Betaproteobacteria bacterium]|nr:AI-2E family transporter [Betaproteobacteria bacterium]